jgi:hypothetical protein
VALTTTSSAAHRSKVPTAASNRLALETLDCANSKLTFSNPAAWSFFAATDMRAREVNAKSELFN